jgi:PAS domain S-box-containing protein
VAHAVKDESGKLEFVGAVMDVTEQHHAKAALEKAFAEIKKSEDDLRIIIDTIPTLAWRTLPDGSAEYINQRWLNYTGLSAEEAAGWGWTVALHDEDSTNLMDKWRAAVATGEPFEAEARFRRADGKYRWFLARGVPLRDELGNIVRWYGTNTDIDDRKQAEEIRTAQVRHAGFRADVSAALSRPAPLGEILRGCAEAIVRHLDAAFARIWTLNKEENMLKLQASAGMYTHLDGPHSRVPIGKLKIGLIAEEKKPHLTNDVMNDPRVSDKHWAQNEGMVSFAGYPLIVEDSVVGVMAMFARKRLSAVTIDLLGSVADSIAQGIERKQTEDKVRQSEAYLAEAQRLSLTGSFGWNVSSGQLYWSAESFRIFGYDRATKPTVEMVLQRVHPEDVVFVQETLARASRDGADLDFEHRLQMPDSAVKYVHVVAHAVRDESGKLEFVGAVMDVTERKRAEEALRNTQADLARVARVTTLGELTATIAHEVNQPLAAIVTNGNASLRWLASQPPNLEEARQALVRTINEGHRAGEVIARVRALASKAPPQKSWLDINETILEVLALTRSQVQKHRIALETQLATDLPLILGDRIQLQQVLLNLVLNAVEAMTGASESPRQLVVSASKDETKGVLVAVCDSGPGLEAASLEQLFETFYTTKADGMGMGLSISRSIIEAHGGRLWATPNEGQGATFKFTLQACGMQE